MLKGDFHTHTCYCDGRDTPGQMARAAFERGLEDFGVSGHAYFPYGWDQGMTVSSFNTYQKELEKLKAEYAGRMNLYTGVELDCLGPVWKADYTIGSVHCVKKKGNYVMVDSSEQKLQKAVRELWNGDWYGLVRDYYELESTVVEGTGCSLIGHFDLVTKFNQDFRLFDENDERYLEPAISAMRRLNQAGIPFEINTGAISRGFRREPYPSRRLLEELHRMGGKIIINSDSHRQETIGFGFEEAILLAKECGFSHTCILKPGGGFREIELKN